MCNFPYQERIVQLFGESFPSEKCWAPQNS
jgi:hypothetical protein